MSQIKTSATIKHIFGILRNPAQEKESEQPSIIKLQWDDAKLEQINNTRIRNINPKILPNLMSGLEQKLIRILIF